MRETDEDRQNEVLAMSEVCGNWRCEAFKLPHFHSLDHALIRGKTVFAIAEVKVRSSSWRQHKRVMVSLDKVLRARQIGRAAGLKTFLIVRWTDGLGFINFEAEMSVEIAGRTDRAPRRPTSLPYSISTILFSSGGTKMEPKQQKAQILLIPRDDGFLVVIDGKETMKPMSAVEMLMLANRCIGAGLEMLRQRSVNER